MANSLGNALLFLVSQTALGGFVFFFTEFHIPVKKWQRIRIAGISLIVVSNFLLILFGGYDLYVRIALLTVTLPYLIISVLSSQFRGMRAIFNLVTILFTGCIATVNSALIVYLAPDSITCKTVARILSYLVLLLFVKALREPYLRMLRMFHRGWTLLRIPAFLIFLISHTVLRSPVSGDPRPHFLLLYCLIAIGLSVYGIIYLFFNRVQVECEARQYRRFITAQVIALEQQTAAVRESEERARIYRHDIRHCLHTVEQQLKEGRAEDALLLLSDVKELVQESKAPIYCENLTVNASLAYYLERAKAEGITVDASVSLPSRLRLNAAELAVALSNALENAIHACKNLKSDSEKQICLGCTYSGGQIAIQLENPCPGTLRYDSDGLPLSDENGFHGIGMHSMAAFARKYGAMLQCEQKDGHFILRMLIDDKVTG